MKKIIGIFILFLVFTINTNAQENRVKHFNVQAEAKLNLAELMEVTRLGNKMSSDILRLFEYKFRSFNENLSHEQKVELAKIIEAKLRASLSQDQMLAIEKKEGLLKKLTN